MKKSISVIGLMTISGLTLACTLKFLPPFKIDVSLWDIFIAWTQDYQNPARAAAMQELDRQGEEAFGAVEWKKNNYQGYIYPVTSVGSASGAAQVFIDKPCNQKAIDGATTGEANGGSSGGGGGGFETGGSGGTGGGMGGGCSTETYRSCAWQGDTFLGCYYENATFCT